MIKDSQKYTFSFKDIMKYKAFTLLEIILVIAAIGILASIVVIAINPQRQLEIMRDTVRKDDVLALDQALEQYSIDEVGLDSLGIGSEVQEVCNTGDETVGGPTDCTGLVDLRPLVPRYINRIPKDSEVDGTGYYIYLNSENNFPSIQASNPEVQEAPIGANLPSNPPALASVGGLIDQEFLTNSGTGIGLVPGTYPFLWDLAQQPDGKTLVAGQFDGYNGVNQQHLVRLNTNGTRDTSFGGYTINAGAPSVHVQSDGKILVGGWWFEIPGHAWGGSGGLIRLNSNGTLDTNFVPDQQGPNPGGGVYSIDTDSAGRAIIGGGFTDYDSVSRRGIARVLPDGKLDTSFNPGTGFTYSGDGGMRIKKVEHQLDGKIMVVGRFDNYNGHTQSGVIRLNSDGSRDTTFNVSIDQLSTTYDFLTLPDGGYMIAGGFQNVNGVPRFGIAQLNSDGTLNTSFIPQYGGGIFALHRYPNGTILGVGSNISNSEGVQQFGSLLYNPDGSRNFTYETNQGIGSNQVARKVIVQSDGKIILGGDFTNFNGTTVGRLVRLR